MKLFNTAAPHIQDSYDTKIIWPFGPCIYQTIIEDDLKDSLLTGGRIIQENDQDYRLNLAGNLYNGGSYFYGEKYKERIAPAFINLALQWLEYMKENFGINSVDFTPGHEFDPNSVYLESLWINFQRKFDLNPIHNHRGIISFVVYLQVPEEIFEVQMTSNTQKAGEILFYYGESASPLSHSQYAVKPFDNLLLMFPASLNHTVYPFWIDAERISVSGNIDLRQTYRRHSTDSHHESRII